MLKSYLFVPSNNKKFLDKIPCLNPDHFILDMEESVSISELDIAMSNLKKIDQKYLHYVRPEFRQGETVFDTSWLFELLKIGYRKFLLPKIQSIDQLEAIGNVLSDAGIYQKRECQFILLVENPLILIDLKVIIQNSNLNITGIALGSHDYCSEMGALHTKENIFYARSHILNVAKAYGLQAIDTASVEINNVDGFVKECINSFNMGFDAKVAIHPSQVDLIMNTKYYTDSEIDEAVRVMKIKTTIPEDNYSLIQLDGKVFEKPHMKRIEKIFEWYERSRR